MQLKQLAQLLVSSLHGHWPWAVQRVHWHHAAKQQAAKQQQAASHTCLGKHKAGTVQVASIMVSSYDTQQKQKPPGTFHTLSESGPVRGSCVPYNYMPEVTNGRTWLHRATASHTTALVGAPCLCMHKAT